VLSVLVGPARLHHRQPKRHQRQVGEDREKEVAMNDLETVVAMLARAKFDYEREIVGETLKHAGCTVLTIERGYSGFVSQLFFDAQGNLVSIEAYE